LKISPALPQRTPNPFLGATEAKQWAKGLAAMQSQEERLDTLIINIL